MKMDKLNEQQRNSPELALYPLGQIMSHFNGKVLTVQRLHLVQGISLKLLGLDPHCHLENPEAVKGFGY